MLRFRPRDGDCRSVRGKEVVVFSRMVEGGGLRAIRFDLVIIEKQPYWDLELQSFDIVDVYLPKKANISPRPGTNPLPLNDPGIYLPRPPSVTATRA